ncbi:MAG: hypothetical protein ABSF55_03545 [Candidatus Staskawiczbacteria bacterium]|jgi:hypothetical protein
MRDKSIFYEGLAVSEDSQGWFHVLESGKPAYPQRYKKTECFQNGLAWVQKEDGTWIKINRQGQEVPIKSTNAPL